MNALEIRGLTKSFKDFRLENIDLTLPAGTIMGLIGENGAGKSTTIRLILDMIRRDAGTVTVLGQDNRGPGFRALKEQIGVVFDEVGIPDCLSAEKTGRVMAGIYKSWDEKAYRGYLEQLELPEKKEFKDYSRGMKMKLGIAVAMSHHPKLLLLDEATSGLDPVVRDEVTEMLLDFTRDESHSVLVSSHIVSDLERICDYVAFLHRGKLLLCEEKDALKEQYGIVHTSAEELRDIPGEAILHRRDTAYGTDALVRRDALPQGIAVGDVSIEELFVEMVKGERK